MACLARNDRAASSAPIVSDALWIFRPAGAPSEGLPGAAARLGEAVGGDSFPRAGPKRGHARVRSRSCGGGGRVSFAGRAFALRLQRGAATFLAGPRALSPEGRGSHSQGIGGLISVGGQVQAEFAVGRQQSSFHRAFLD